jgi:membrane-associated protease RseP (regulator of RpoE activity)
MEERMGFARMTVLSAVAAVVGVGGMYASASPAAGQGRRVIIEREGDGPDRVIVNEGQDDGQERGGKRVIVRKGHGDDDEGPGFDMFAFGGARVGMVVRDVETADVAKEKLAGAAGAVVTEVVKDSAAAKAGVKTGDVVTSFDGERVRSARQLERLVEETPAGRTVKVALHRAGAPVTLDVTPEAPKMTRAMPGMPGGGGDVFRFEKRQPGGGPDFEGPQGMPFKFEMPAGRFDFDGEPFMAASRGRLGVRVQDLSEELAGYFGVKSGVLVAGVEADAPAGKAGVKAGDVITAVNGQAITDPGELRREVAKVEDGKTADLAVTRDKKPLTLKVEVTARDRTIERKQRRSL